MLRLAFLACLISVTVFAHQSRPVGNSANGLQDFSFVVGRWAGMFHMHPNARMPKAAESQARMIAKWGPQNAWIESEATTDLPGMGPYVAKVLVGFDPRGQNFDSFVMNTVGGSARYSGKREGNRVVFVGQMGSVTQRVTYENLSYKEMRFVVEDSRDAGKTFQPHSDIVWKRQ